ncbi:MAG: hypothetical protein AAF718_08170 [Pseudomonadota bacterium]
MRPYMMSPYSAFLGNAPFGGAVTQAFEFWSDWFDQVGQIGLINIDIGKTDKPDLEREILNEVGSYGRQIGQIADAVAILLEKAALDRTKLSDEEIVALHKFREMVDHIDNCKKNY